MEQRVHHPLDPIYDKHSRILLLGTMPSPKSRELGFYYAHPRNRFWQVMAALFPGEPPFDRETPASPEEKRVFLLDHRIALWDVLASCTIRGADDASIQDPVPNNLNRILSAAPIQKIFTTGTKAFSLYKVYCQKETGREAVCLPSTSPANCACSFERLAGQYRQLLKYL